MSTVMKKILLTTIALIVTGCASEVDKCVDANMQSWSERQARIKGGEKIPLPFGDGFYTIDTRTPTEMSALYRMQCLKLSGKQ